MKRNRGGGGSIAGSGPTGGHAGGAPGGGLAVAVLLLAIAAAGCGTKMVITPQVAGRDVGGFKVGGTVVYDGNPEYLPRTVAPAAAGESGLSFRYAYQCVYGRDNVHQALPLFNPLTAIGFPIGADTLVVAGKLDVHEGDVLVKSYTATCAFDKTRNIFHEGATFSELRKQGLIAVRDNIEIQMFEDREFLSSRTGRR